MKTKLLLIVFLLSPTFCLAKSKSKTLPTSKAVEEEIQAAQDPEAGAPTGETVIPAAPPEEQADDQGPGSMETSVERKPRWTVGLLRENFYYREPGLMSDRAVLTGFDLQAWIPTTSERLAVKGGLNYVSGTGTYDGQTMSGVPLTASTVNYIFNLRGLLDWKTLSSDHFDFDLFGGFAARGLANNQSGPGSYRREITYSYLPVGFLATAKFKPGISIGLGAEYDVFVGGTVRTHLSDASSSLPDLENTQKSGRGQRLNAQISGDFGRFAVNLEYYTQYWFVDDSNVVYVGTTGFYEPKNDTSISGLALSVTF